MRTSVNASLKSLSLSLAVALGVSLCVAALWSAGLLSALEAVFIIHRGEAVLAQPQAWLTTSLVLFAGVGAGALFELAGGRRATLLAGVVLAVLCAASFLASRFFQLDINFAAVALAAVGGGVAVQVRRLWEVDAQLARGVRRVSARVSALEGREAHARLTGGLRLLDSVLSLDEAVVFHFDEAGALVPAARLRPSSAGAQGTLETQRNAAWREGVKLCERAVRTGEMLHQHRSAQTGGAAPSSPRPQSGATGVGSVEADLAVEQTRTPSPLLAPADVALPLRHENQTVGALLVRLREEFDEADRALLATVGAQLARNLQRDGARRVRSRLASATLFSATAAARRLDDFDLISGLIAEQGFAAQVLHEAQDGHAVVYLDGAIACVNEPMLSAARLTADEARSLDLFGLLDCFRAGVFDEPSIAVRRVLQTGESYERELHFAERNQTLALRINLVTENLPVEKAAAETRGAPVRPLCFAITVRDVTRIKEYEKLKSDMLSLMSHELRTPITSINGFAELLMQDESVPAEAREFLSIIHGEAQRLSRMINTFLSVTRLEQSDRQEVLKIPLMLDDVVRETMSSLQPVAKKKRIRLVEKDGARLPPVAADRSLITRVMTNLVDNAIRYSPERTTVTISTALEADAVRVTVEDRGYGIPPESVDRVWEKFYRVARDGQDKEEESTGLGLSFVREVVEQHGGTVALDTEVGRGSKFSFTLPRL